MFSLWLRHPPLTNRQRDDRERANNFDHDDLAVDRLAVDRRADK